MTDSGFITVLNGISMRERTFFAAEKVFSLKVLIF